MIFGGEIINIYEEVIFLLGLGVEGMLGSYIKFKESIRVGKYYRNYEV